MVGRRGRGWAEGWQTCVCMCACVFVFNGMFGWLYACSVSELAEINGGLAERIGRQNWKTELMEFYCFILSERKVKMF